MLFVVEEFPFVSESLKLIDAPIQYIMRLICKGSGVYPLYNGLSCNATPNSGIYTERVMLYNYQR